MATPPVPNEGTVVYDACVLYPAPLRDLLMWLALVGPIRARWTDRIHDEWTRNLLANRSDIRPEQLARVRRLMDLNVPDGLITGFEPLIDGLTLPDPDDRHVLAAAIHGGAGRIVTFNLADFPAQRLSPLKIRAEHPDDFVVGQLDADPIAACSAIARQRAALKRPLTSVDDLLNAFAQQRLPRTVDRLRPLAHLL